VGFLLPLTRHHRIGGWIVDERQAHAYAHPITDPRTILDDPLLCQAHPHPGGFLIVTLLAVDR